MTQEEESVSKTTVQTPTDLAFVFSLIGGTLITIGSVVGMVLVGMARPFPFFWGMMGGGMMGSNYYPSMMGGYYGMMMLGLESVGIVTGVLVLAFSVLMKSRPTDRKTFGILILAFSLVSLVGMGGFFIGAILGLVGGVLALVNT